MEQLLLWYVGLPIAAAVFVILVEFLLTLVFVVVMSLIMFPFIVVGVIKGMRS